MPAFDGQIVLNDDEPIHSSHRTDDSRDGGAFVFLCHFNHQLTCNFSVDSGPRSDCSSLSNC